SGAGNIGAYQACGELRPQVPCVMLFPPALMSHPSSLPRICIALGFPDAQKLLEHARREINAGESFFEFRPDYLAAPEQGIAVIRKFLASHPDCSILAACRRHQNHGKFNGSVED